MNKAIIFINGVIGEDTILLDVIRQFKSFENPSEVEVIIDSVGGGVTVGKSIYQYLRNLNIPVTTVAKTAYSIAAHIFMAGDNRVVEAGADRVMVHFPWATFSGGADDFSAVANELRELENEFITFYSEHTSIDKDTIKQILQNETFLNADEAVEMGLATQIKTPLKAVAYYNKEVKQITKQMTNKEKFIQAFNAFLGVDADADIKALVITDANGELINFPSVEEGLEPQVGDKAVDADDKPITGEIVMIDGSTWVFENGELKEIVPVEEEVEEEEVEEEEIEEEVVAEVTEEEFDFEALLTAFEDSITAKFTVKITDENKKLQAEILALKKLIGSEEAIVKASNNNKNINNKNTNNDLPSGLQGLMAIRKNK
jgi:ATP-dependent protease ClpP protease subunit